MVGIYKIENMKNNKKYIGQSICIEDRWKDHTITAHNENDKHYEYPLYRSIRKYGIENFSFSVLELCNEEFLNDREIFWIAELHSHISENGYNQTRGGDSCSERCRKITQESYNKIIECLKNKNFKNQQVISEALNISLEYVQGINTGRLYKEFASMDEKFPIRNFYNNNVVDFKKTKEKKYCLDCGKEIYKTSKRCVKCENIRKGSKKTNIEDLIYIASIINEKNSVCKAATELGIKHYMIYKMFKKIDKNLTNKDNIINWYCEKNNIKRKEIIKEEKQEYKIKKFLMYSLEGKFEKEFSQMKEIQEYFLKNYNQKITSSHIYSVCNGKRKSAHGKIWKEKVD